MLAGSLDEDSEFAEAFRQHTPSRLPERLKHSLVHDHIRFHLDEHVDPAVPWPLRRAGVDVTTTQESELRGATTKVIWSSPVPAGRVIVTRERDFLLIAGPDSTGIAFFSATHSIREIIEGLVLMYEVLTPPEMLGHIEYL